VASKSAKYRFSDHFGINKPQSQLDFVDIPLNTDVRLYVDPYALSVSGDDWLRECGHIVVSFFDHFLQVLRENDEPKAMRVIANFHEPNDTHLGMSRGKPSGRGWGRRQSRMLFERLSRSAAVRSGKLKDLTDVELLIPGIANDKISDLTTNVLRGEFVAYTEEQCQLFKIPTEKINSGPYWDFGLENWTSKYANLPVYDNQRILLVPKAAVRARLIPDHEDYYNRFVLDFLGAEHLRANDALVTLLKNGDPKVYRKDLKNKYSSSKEFLFEFSIKHPEVLANYKKSLRKMGAPLTPSAIEERQRTPRSLIEAGELTLDQIPAGSAHASAYHSCIVGILTEIFYPWLTHPTKEQEVNEGRKRIDIVFSNSASDGFFSRLVNMHKIHCPYVNIECKNYSEDPANPELDQLIGRFSRKRGKFGILVCRKIDNRPLLLKRLKDVVNDTDGAIIVLDDSDVNTLTSLKRAGEDQKVNEYLEASLKQILV
jgi:hypothetical protein